MIRRAGLTIAAAGILASTVGVANAAPILISPVSVTASSSYPTYDASNAIDQGPGSELTDWASLGEGAAATLNINLGAVYSLANVFVTDRVTSGGPNNAFYGGTTDFTTSFTLQAFTDATFTTAASALLTFNHATPISPTSPADFLYTGALGGLTGQYIQYKVVSFNTGFGNTGLSNIVFSAVPEPTTWGLMLVGFGAVGGAMRYRRRKTVVTFA